MNLLSIFKTIINSFIKLSWVTKVCAVLLSLFIPILPVFYTIIFLVVVDLITGVSASIKICKDEDKFEPKNGFHMLIYSLSKIKSRLLRDGTVTKLFGYLLLIFVSHLIDTYLFQGTFFGIGLTNIVQSFLGFIEFLSILENIAKMTNQPILMKLLTWINKDFEKKYGINIEKELKEQEKEKNDKK